jgi:hypothetical protein
MMRMVARTGAVAVVLALPVGAVGTTALAQAASADVVAELLGPSYRLVGGSEAADLTVNVRAPSPGGKVTLAATFDLRAVQHAVAFTADDPDECEAVNIGIRCEQEVDGTGRDTVVATHMLWMSPLSGGPTGPAGQVTVTVERVGAGASSSVGVTLDVVRGNWLGKVDFGDVTGRVGETVTAPVTITNVGPNTFQYIAIGHAPRYGGVELVGYEGCASNPYAPSGYCAAPPWFTAGSTYHVGIRLKITRCPDSDAVGGTILASKARVDDDGMGRLTVTGCGGAAPPPGGGGQPAGATTGGAQASGAEVAITPSPTPTGARPTSTPATLPPAAALDAPAGAAGDWLPVGQRQLDAGLGSAGLILLLGLLAIARSVRWVFARHAGTR